ncbi:Fungalysin metallopeptidase-domain-containing protein [Infundibulicybe gibba]|nr:Fungalysin metallopeptidase-domain-containing protein [Infundibulicybe gibba]
MTRRMVGGGSARCFDTKESRGLGEGFSDAMAEYMGAARADPARVVSPGLRVWTWYPTEEKPPRRRVATLSILDIEASSSRWATTTSPIIPPGIGEIWANMLHNVYAALLKVHGFSVNARADATTLEGNVVFMNLFIHALSLLPCNPTFLHARDAWIQADQNKYGGDYKCLLWKAFASRGFGVSAWMDSERHTYVDGADVPPDCGPQQPAHRPPPVYSPPQPPVDRPPPAYSPSQPPDHRPPPAYGLPDPAGLPA